MDAFPRLREHQQNLNACVQMDEIGNELLKFLAQYPCALFYCGNVEKQMNVFYQRNLRKTQKTTLSPELNTADGTSMPNVFLCVLTGEYGHLSSIDTACLQKVKKELSDHWIDKALFVVTATSFSGSLRNFNTLSYEIGKELGIDMKTLTFRIFKDKDEDIFERMSLYFEQELVEKRYDLSRHLQSLGSDITLALQHTLSPSFTERLKRILLAGPLGVSLLDKLKDASRSYEWEKESFTRNKATVTEAADKIARFACETLGREIVETLIRHFTREMLSSNQDFSIAIFRYINLKDIGSTVLKDLLIALFSLFFGPVGWLISAIIIFFSGTEINSISFRDEVACKMITQIHQNKDKIIQEVVKKFRSDVIPRFKAIQIALENSDIELRRIFGEKEHLIRKESIEHEFQTIAGKNELIRNFKFEDDTLKIYASGDEKNYADVKEFVDTYFRPDVRTQVIMD
ncbi:uncharacterized protein LOC127732082 [Mytilus californianus]|uniref:uncharacterized protein LOC127732082 n=1 Tax=Mytilus californianus TaxID=6549 RepID=UPI002246311F|nr:uncharacterized protein LOC127732082 [Mytilus californianus]